MLFKDPYFNNKENTLPSFWRNSMFNQNKKVACWKFVTVRPTLSLRSWEPVCNRKRDSLAEVNWLREINSSQMSSKALWCKPLGTTLSDLHPPFDTTTQGLTFSSGPTGNPHNSFFISRVEEDFESVISRRRAFWRSKITRMILCAKLNKNRKRIIFNK